MTVAEYRWSIWLALWIIRFYTIDKVSWAKSSVFSWFKVLPSYSSKPGAGSLGILKNLSFGLRFRLLEQLWEHQKSFLPILNNDRQRQQTQWRRLTWWLTPQGAKHYGSCAKREFGRVLTLRSGEFWRLVGEHFDNWEHFDTPRARKKFY